MDQMIWGINPMNTVQWAVAEFRSERDEDDVVEQGKERVSARARGRELGNGR